MHDIPTPNELQNEHISSIVTTSPHLHFFLTISL